MRRSLSKCWTFHATSPLPICFTLVPALLLWFYLLNTAPEDIIRCMACRDAPSSRKYLEPGTINALCRMRFPP